MSQTLRDDLEADLTRVFLDTRHFAQSVTRHVEGDANDTETLTAIFTEESSSKKTDRGRDNERRGMLLVGPDDTVNVRDAFVIDGAKWRVESKGVQPGGMQELRLIRVEPYLRTRSDRGSV